MENVNGPDAIRMQIIRKIMEIASEERLKEINALVHEAEGSVDWWDELSEKAKKDIEAGTEELRSGKGRPFEEFIAKYD